VAWRVFDRKQAESGEWSGFLEEGVSVEGRIEVPGTLRVDCRAKGNLICEGTLILGEHATVEGEAKARTVIIAGRFDGVIEARESAEIQAKAIVRGEIHTPCLILEPGAIFEGHCHVVSAKESVKPITIPIRSAVAPT
jgi:cytoskeletal protein CcmA (bactofilin family)